MPPILNVVTIIDRQKEDALLDYHLRGILLNYDAINSGDVVLYYLVQNNPDSKTHRWVRRTLNDYGIDHGGVPNLTQQRAGPNPADIIWNVFADLNRIDTTLTADYVLVLHKETVLQADYLNRLVSYLRWKRPVVALANMCRVGAAGEWSTGVKAQNSSCRDTSLAVRRAIDTSPADELAAYLETVPAQSWPLRWQSDNIDRHFRSLRWAEDAFVADRRWLFDVINLFGIDPDHLPLIDIYGPMKQAMRYLERTKLAPPVERFIDSRILHLWHEKTYSHLNENVVRWFEESPIFWAGTSYADIDRMREVIGFDERREEYRGRPNPIREMREIDYRRFARLFHLYMTGGGGLERLRNYYRENTHVSPL
jgi:hypothetical protein